MHQSCDVTSAAPAGSLARDYFLFLITAAVCRNINYSSNLILRRHLTNIKSVTFFTVDRDRSASVNYLQAYLAVVPFRNLITIGKYVQIYDLTVDKKLMRSCFQADPLIVVEYNFICFHYHTWPKRRVNQGATACLYRVPERREWVRKPNQLKFRSNTDANRWCPPNVYPHWRKHVTIIDGSSVDFTVRKARLGNTIVAKPSSFCTDCLASTFCSVYSSLGVSVSYSEGYRLIHRRSPSLSPRSTLKKQV